MSSRADKAISFPGYTNITVPAAAFTGARHDQDENDIERGIGPAQPFETELALLTFDLSPGNWEGRRFTIARISNGDRSDDDTTACCNG